MLHAAHTLGQIIISSKKQTNSIKITCINNYIDKHKATLHEPSSIDNFLMRQAYFSHIPTKIKSFKKHITIKFIHAHLEKRKQKNLSNCAIQMVNINVILNHAFF